MGLNALAFVLALSTASPTETYCMAQAIYFEARSEGVRGQIAVAEVVLARKNNDAFPDTVCRVVYQPGQFSFLIEGLAPEIRNEAAWKLAVELAHAVLSGEIVAGRLTGGALFYHADYVCPDWADEMVKTAEIGNHIFYRPREI